MSDNPPTCNRLSVVLSQVLDELGLDDQSIQREPERLRKYEPFLSVSKSFWQREPCTCYVFGSRVEGTTTPGLKSDMDILTCFDNVNVVLNENDRQPRMTNVLLVENESAPGYCRLQLLGGELPKIISFTPERYIAMDTDNRMFITNTWTEVFKVNETDDIQGPAITSLSPIPGTSIDYVYAFKCLSWTPSGLKWTNRTRNHWPPKNIIYAAASDEIFLVPIGHKLSDNKNLEYRISYSLTERRLMLTLNDIQRKCLVVLKMIVKTFVKPTLGECLTSYHCKSALFYCIEDTRASFWRNEILLQCIVKCLEMLLEWIDNISCPHFILPQCNLFTGKVTESNKYELQSILSSLISSDGHFLLDVSIDGLGQTLQKRLDNDNDKHDLKSVDGREATKSHFIGELSLSFHTDYLLQNEITVENLKNDVSLLKKLKQSTIEKDKRLEYEKRIAELIVIKGSIMTSLAFTKHQGIPRQAAQLFKTRGMSTIWSMLKVAFIYYCGGELQKAEETLQAVAEYYLKESLGLDTGPACQTDVGHSTQRRQASQEHIEDRVMLVHADYITFSYKEIYCTPLSLRPGFCELEHVDWQTQYINRLNTNRKMNPVVTVDCLPFFRYLQYVTYGKLKRRDKQMAALRQLELILKDDWTWWVNHQSPFSEDVKSPSGWNLLGLCWEQEGNLVGAMNCYKESFKLQPCNTVAHWNMAMLCLTYNTRKWETWITSQGH